MVFARTRVKRGRRFNPKRWLIFLGLIIFSFLLVRLILSYRKSVWKKGRFNFVIASDPVLVFSLSAKKKSLTVVKIPQNTYVEVTRGFGLYRAEAVYPLGQLEGMGGNLLSETIQEFLGVPIEGWVRTRGKLFQPLISSKLDKNEILLLRKQIATLGVFLRPKVVIKFLKEDLKTNIPFWDLVKIWLRVREANAARIYFFDLERDGVLNNFPLPDGGSGKTGDPRSIDNLLEDFFFESEIRREKISIEVLNGTDSPGLAQRAARIITNLGGKVSQVKDNKKKVEKCQIEGDLRVLKSVTFFKIQKIFDCQVFKEEKEGLSLIIGESYQKKLFSKEETLIPLRHLRLELPS